jgi:hypothetical protein
LNSGEYDFRLRVVRDAETPVLDVPNVGSFEVLEVHRPSNWWQGEWMGVVRPTLTWSSELTQDEDRQALAVS